MRELPWWVTEKDGDAIAEAGQGVDAVTYDGRPAPIELPDVELEELARFIARGTRVAGEDLSGACRGADVVEARIRLTAVAVQHYGHSVKDVAEPLRKNPATVSRWLFIARNRLRDETGFAVEISSLAASAAAEHHNAIKRYVAP